MYYYLTAAAAARHGGVVEQVSEARLAAALVTDAGALLVVTSQAAVDGEAFCMHGHGDEITRLAHKRIAGRSRTSQRRTADRSIKLSSGCFSCVACSINMVCDLRSRGTSGIGTVRFKQALLKEPTMRNERYTASSAEALSSSRIRLVEDKIK